MIESEYQDKIYIRLGRVYNQIAEATKETVSYEQLLKLFKDACRRDFDMSDDGTDSILKAIEKCIKPFSKIINNPLTVLKKEYKSTDINRAKQFTGRSVLLLGGKPHYINSYWLGKVEPSRIDVDESFISVDNYENNVVVTVIKVVHNYLKRVIKNDRKKKQNINHWERQSELLGKRDYKELGKQSNMFKELHGNYEPVNVEGLGNRIKKEVELLSKVSGFIRKPLCKELWRNKTEKLPVKQTNIFKMKKEYKEVASLWKIINENIKDTGISKSQEEYFSRNYKFYVSCMLLYTLNKIGFKPKEDVLCKNVLTGESFDIELFAPGMLNEDNGYYCNVCIGNVITLYISKLFSGKLFYKNENKYKHVCIYMNDNSNYIGIEGANAMRNKIQKEAITVELKLFPKNYYLGDNIAVNVDDLIKSMSNNSENVYKVCLYCEGKSGPEIEELEELLGSDKINDITKSLYSYFGWLDRRYLKDNTNNYKRTAVLPIDPNTSFDSSNKIWKVINICILRDAIDGYLKGYYKKCFVCGSGVVSDIGGNNYKCNVCDTLYGKQTCRKCNREFKYSKKEFYDPGKLDTKKMYYERIRDIDMYLSAFYITPVCEKQIKDYIPHCPNCGEHVQGECELDVDNEERLA